MFLKYSNFKIEQYHCCLKVISQRNKVRILFEILAQLSRISSARSYKNQQPPAYYYTLIVLMQPQKAGS